MNILDEFTLENEIRELKKWEGQNSDHLEIFEVSTILELILAKVIELERRINEEL